jgi:hypothetical protein
MVSASCGEYLGDVIAELTERVAHGGNEIRNRRRGRLDADPI